MFRFQFPYSETQRINKIIQGGAIYNREMFIKNEINDFLGSSIRNNMLMGEKYYEGRHDILMKKRTAIGEGGNIICLDNLPNSRIVDNRYKKLVDQKVNYLLGQPIAVRSDNKKYWRHIKKIFNSDFQRLMKNVGQDCMNCGIGWVYIYYDEKGRLTFRRFKPYEIIPGWADSEHTRLDYVIRIYEVNVVSKDNNQEIQQRVEVYDRSGIYRYIYSGGYLTRAEDYYTGYFVAGGKGYNWLDIPIIAFKLNSKEIPLINGIKPLQDGLNLMLSAFQDNMQEDCRNTILILKNYDGENLGEFRKNLATYGAVKVRTVDGSQGGVEALSVEVNAENYKSVIELFKKTIIENGNGFDNRDDRLFSSPNQLNIKSMYSDMELDANSMELEFQCGISKILDFVKADLFNKGFGDYFDREAEIIFNRDILINESEVIDNCIKSRDILSAETIVAQHPWVDDIYAEEQKLKRGVINEADDK